MKVTVYSTRAFEKEYLQNILGIRHEINYINLPLSLHTATLAQGSEAICIFVSDDASGAVLEVLNREGVKFIALRSAGYNHIDLAVAKKLNMKVARVPDYSPYAVGEHAVALMLALNRKLIHSHNRVLAHNFSLDGLVGFDMHGKTVGIIGTGKIGSVVARIMNGFGCRILLHDKIENEALKIFCNATYTDIERLYREADIITLHVPLTSETKYLIDKNSILKMKPGLMLINTGRGALVNTKDIVDAIKVGKIGYFGMDVYENEAGLFFEDHSEEILEDDVIARLMTFNNVIITGHQGFLTDTALKNIALATGYNLDCFQENRANTNEVIFE